jgi:hypothetical protein
VITPSGELFALDAQGCILNPTAFSKIDPAFLPLVPALIACYQRHHGDDLYAVYLRGSVPRGMPLSSIADIDVVGILACNDHAQFIRWASPPWAATEMEGLSARYPMTQQIDFAIAHRDEAMPGRNASVKMMLQTQGLCVFGTDDSADWPRCRADRNAAFNHRWLAAELQHWHAQYAGRPATTAQSAFLKSLAKTTIRAGFELVIERSGSYTVDLYPCMQAFGRYYPAQKGDMEDVMRTFLDPTITDSGALDWIERLLPLLISEAILHLGA